VIEDTNPAQENTSQEGFVNVIKLTDLQEKSYSDLTGRFLVHSIDGNLYVLVLCPYDTNAILVELLKSQSETDQVKAYKRILQCIPAQFRPRTHVMDNEASKG
jgi:mRNA-degrading endonuclease HigB of HigAB toxin-antitoxin module